MEESCYTDSEIRRNRKMISKWSKRLLGAAIVCFFLFVCTDEYHDLPWYLIILGTIFSLAGLTGLVILDSTSTPRCYEYR